MKRRLERWLDRKVPIEEDEIELSEGARQRVYRSRQGQSAVLKGIIRFTSTPGRYSLSEHEGPDAPMTFMTEDEIDHQTELVDARILGDEGHKYDDVFSELRDSRAVARYESITRKARRWRMVGGFAGAAALGLICGAARLPLPRLVGEDNCYEHVGNGGNFIERVSDFDPRSIESAPTCELGGQEYVILPTKSLR